MARADTHYGDERLSTDHDFVDGQRVRFVARPTTHPSVRVYDGREGAAVDPHPSNPLILVRFDDGSECDMFYRTLVAVGEG